MASGRLSKVKGKVVDIPTVPTIGTATAGGESATVAFTPATKGGSASTYTALSNPGSVTGSGASSPVTVSGLTAGTAYTFTVRGNNVTGSSEYSSASNSVTPTVSPSYESIATITSPGSSPTSFTSIPQTFKHLQIRYILRDTGGSGFSQGSITVNSSGASNMAYHKLSGDGSTVTSSAAASEGYWSTLFLAAMNSTTAGTFAAGIIDILDYTDTNKNKTMRILAGGDGNGSGQVLLGSGFVNSTTAISSITFYAPSNGFATNTQIALYGIKGA